MASIDTGGGDAKGSKKKRKDTRVDFTPMVDMMMLLLTFFMFCTTLSKPQIMDIAMPMPDDEEQKKQDPADTKASKAITMILGADNKVFYYTGLPNYEEYTSLKETTFPTAESNGFRDVLMEKNAGIIKAMRELKQEKADNPRMPEEDFKERAKKIRSDKEGQVVVIKPTMDATYKNLVDALDEMAICSVGRYAVVDMAEGDEFMLQNYETKGEYGQGRTVPKK